MIAAKDVFKIGKLQKSHGIKGEIVLLFDKDVYADIDVDFYFLEIDGIFVPFCIEEMTFKTDVSARVKFEDIDDESKASQFANLSVYVHRDTIQHDSENEPADDWHFFVGYNIVDQHDTLLGEITAVDDATLNVLFLVKNKGIERMIPATEDFITAILPEQRILHMQLPDGLLEA